MESAFLSFRKLSCVKRCAVALLVRKRRAGDIQATSSISDPTKLNVEGGNESPWEVLFIKRAMRPRDTWAGHVAFPGGWGKEGELDLDTMIRESHEELGIDLRKHFVYLGNVDDIQLMGYKTLAMACGVFKEVSGDYKIIVNPSEVSDYLWVPVEETVREESIIEYCYTLPPPFNFNLYFPAISLRKQGSEWGCLWGLTHMLYGDFTKRIGHRQIQDERLKLKYRFRRKLADFILTIRGARKMLIPKS